MLLYLPLTVRLLSAINGDAYGLTSMLQVTLSLERTSWFVITQNGHCVPYEG